MNRVAVVTLWEVIRLIGIWGLIGGLIGGAIGWAIAQSYYKEKIREFREKVAYLEGKLSGGSS
ncbi:hypothetical protein ES703_49847 [subsurface metagenome]